MKHAAINEGLHRNHITRDEGLFQVSGVLTPRLAPLQPISNSHTWSLRVAPGKHILPLGGKGAS